MWNYTEKVMEHFLHPHNVGEITDADGVGEVGNITCGDALKLYLKVSEDGKHIEDVKFQTFGCASAIASASALTDLVKGKTVEEAERITNQDIAGFLGELPEEKMHCSVMGMEALEAALANLRGESDGRMTSSEHATEDEYDPEGLDRTVCFCFSVSERKIRDVIKANNLTTVDQITHYCKAGGGCGGCKPELAVILEKVRGEEKAASEAKLEEGKKPKKLTNLQKINLIQTTVDAEIRPALQADGGDLELVDIDGNIVYVQLTGSCAGCPSAHITLKRWVEAKLKELVSEDIEVKEAEVV